MYLNHWIDLNLKASRSRGLRRKNEKDHHSILQEKLSKKRESYRREGERESLLTGGAFSCREKVVDFWAKKGEWRSSLKMAYWSQLIGGTKIQIFNMNRKIIQCKRKGSVQYLLLWKNSWKSYSTGFVFKHTFQDIYFAQISSSSVQKFRTADSGFFCTYFRKPYSMAVADTNFEEFSTVISDEFYSEFSEYFVQH